MAAFKPRRTLREVICGTDIDILSAEFVSGIQKDPHAATAARVFGKPVPAVTREERGFGKMVNYGLIYGMPAAELEDRIEKHIRRQ